jgi:hypothetical protein
LLAALHAWAVPARPCDEPGIAFQPNLVLKALPFQALLWIDETKIIAAGYDCVPMLVANQGAGWCGLYARRGHLRALPWRALIIP